VKGFVKPIPTDTAVVSPTKHIAWHAPLQFAAFVIALIICTFCAVDGGYQFHLSHDHSALRCVAVAMELSEVNGTDPIPLQSALPACNDPDELGQPWRIKLVLRDMVGFLIFGIFSMYKGEQAIRAAGAEK
jgi:hypothetical protein